MNPAATTVAIPGYLAGTWKADPVHSEIAFSVRHLMVSKVRGRFTSNDVTIVTSGDPRARRCRDDRPRVHRHRQRTA